MMDAGRQVDMVYRRVPEVIREGMTDLELAAELEYVARREAHPGLIRMRGFNGEMLFGHTFSGTDSAVPTYSDTPLGGMGLSPSFGQGASYKPIGRNEPIIIDFAGSFDGYLVDQTRVFALGGVSARLKKGYDDMLAVQERMKEVARPGVAWGEIYDSCLALAVEQGHIDHFMGARGSQVSFIGHGIGTEIDEYPFIARGFRDNPLKSEWPSRSSPNSSFPERGLSALKIRSI
jgi:Xaa-Pro dipeptidase